MVGPVGVAHPVLSQLRTEEFETETVSFGLKRMFFQLGSTSEPHLSNLKY